MLSFMTQLAQRFQTWKERWFGTLGYYETAIGIYHDPLENTYHLWASYEGLHLLWLSGHRTRDEAEAALPRVLEWARRQGRMDPIPHAVGMALLRDVSDFRAILPSERVQAEILRQIKERTPDVSIIDSTPTEEWWETVYAPRSPQTEAAPNEWDEQVARETANLRALMKAAKQVPPPRETKG